MTTSQPEQHRKPDARLIKITPRGFCAGVERAIWAVEDALALIGAPLYVHHEIVHNTTVVETLKQKGAVFVENLNDIPRGAHVVFSAHGVSRHIVTHAQERDLNIIDATCPLVSKVHAQVRHLVQRGSKVILIGHRGHVEVEGTMGQANQEALFLVENIKDIAALPEDLKNHSLGYVTQTTLSYDETQEMIQALQKRFTHIESPKKQDICYATTNRQTAVKAFVPQCTVLLVVGSPNSSNSNRLVEVAKRAGCTHAFLIDTEQALPWETLLHCAARPSFTIGLTSGASAPENLIDDIVNALDEKFNLTLTEGKALRENVKFKRVLFKENQTQSRSQSHR